MFNLYFDNTNFIYFDNPVESLPTLELCENHLAGTII